MAFSVILLELKLGIGLEYFIYNWDNYTRVRSLIYRLLILLPKQAFVPAIFTGYRAPKHLAYLPLMAVANTVLVVYLVGPPSNPGFSVFTRLCPGFVTPKNTVPLLVRPF